MLDSNSLSLAVAPVPMVFPFLWSLYLSCNITAGCARSLVGVVHAENVGEGGKYGVLDPLVMMDVVLRWL